MSVRQVTADRPQQFGGNSVTVHSLGQAGGRVEIPDSATVIVIRPPLKVRVSRRKTDRSTLAYVTVNATSVVEFVDEL